MAGDPDPMASGAASVVVELIVAGDPTAEATVSQLADGSTHGKKKKRFSVDVGQGWGGEQSWQFG